MLIESRSLDLHLIHLVYEDGLFIVLSVVKRSLFLSVVLGPVVVPAMTLSIPSHLALKQLVLVRETIFLLLHSEPLASSGWRLKDMHRLGRRLLILPSPSSIDRIVRLASETHIVHRVVIWRYHNLVSNQPLLVQGFVLSSDLIL